MRGYYSPIPVIDEEIKRLPDIHGYGTLYSLHEAMQRDVSGQLKNKVREYLAEPNYFTRRQLLRDIIYLWADCQNADPRSRLSENGKTISVMPANSCLLKRLLGGHSEEHIPAKKKHRLRIMLLCFICWIHLTNMQTLSAFDCLSGVF